MRAPPESLSPMTGAPTFIARSMTLQIFSAYASDRDPPKTVKSWLNTNTSRPSIVPWPVTTPSPRTLLVQEAELRGPVGDERIELDERPWVEQQVESLARGELAHGVLSLDAKRSPTEERFGTQCLEARDPFRIRRHDGPPSAPWASSLHKDDGDGVHHMHRTSVHRGSCCRWMNGALHAHCDFGAIRPPKRVVVHRTVHNSTNVWTTCTLAREDRGVAFPHSHRHAGRAADPFPEVSP